MQENKAAQHQMLIDQQRQNQQQYQDVLRIMAEQQRKQEKQQQNFQMLFLQQQQSQILMGLLEKSCLRPHKRKVKKQLRKANWAGDLLLHTCNHVVVIILLSVGA